jgi:phage tail tube protein FII
MADFDDHIKRITGKLQHLLKKYSLLQKENDKLKTELQSLQSSQKEKDEQLQLLTLRIDVLKAAKGEMKEDEKRNFEKRINQYLKEVDKCIAFLNE